MFQYHCLNPIAGVGLANFNENYQQTESLEGADAVLVRSAAMHGMELPKSLLAVARAGAGVNNIPLQDCAEQGIVVFNTPGANANGVKEMVIAGMLLAKRISVPLTKAKETAEKIAEGNYQIRYGADKTNAAALELAQLGQAIDHMAENLEKQEDVRRQLTSDVAHELRTPVANVSSQLEAMIEEVWEPTKERLQSCYDELGRISGIISDLEKLRQIEASNMVLEKEPVDLLELAQAVKTAFEPELAKKKLTCMVTGESAIISGDQKRLHQVIFNLVSNAVKYSTESGQILIDIHNLGKNVQLTVKDQGIGIAKEDIPLIFERFYRTDRSRNRKTGGAGIGLTIVKAIVLAHGGNISVESVKGCGSCFTVVLPKN